ncbi:MAG: carbon-nitrogen hydrolase [Chloroflexi bacterium]|nr:carbon-nitrogen hydrolase [Chloroflexota bacterium]
MRFTLGLMQTNTVLGDLQANLDTHLSAIDVARQQGVDLLCFPELSLTGYYLKDLAGEVALRPDPSDPVFSPLLQASRDLDLVVGFVDQHPRHHYMIASAYLSEGRIAHIHHKCYLPTYGIFDEGRHFAAGNRVQAFDTRFGRVGMLNCEDFWHASMPYLLWADGAELLLLMSASPARGMSSADRFGSSAWVEHVSKAYANLFSVYVAHTNRVGLEDGLAFWGGSLLFDPDGEQVAQAPLWDEALVTAEVDLSQIRRTRLRLPLLRDERFDLTAATLAQIIDKQEEAYGHPV